MREYFFETRWWWVQANHSLESRSQQATARPHHELRASRNDRLEARPLSQPPGHGGHGGHARRHSHLVLGCAGATDGWIGHDAAQLPGDKGSSCTTSTPKRVLFSRLDTAGTDGADDIWICPM